MGRPPLVNKSNMQATADVLASYDASNRPKTTSYVARTVLRDYYGLTKTQAKNFWNHTLKKVTRDGERLLFVGTADPTTKKRTAAITEESQRAYFSLIQGVRALLAKKSAGGDPAELKAFKELEEHFVLNLDEEVALANAHGVKIVGSRQKKRHQVTSHDSRDSISMVRLGNAAGTPCPTIYIIDAEYRKSGHSDAWLVSVGNAPGSTVMTNSCGYIDDLTWLRVAKWLAPRIRALPVIRDHPTWWVRLHMDGLRQHSSIFQANFIFASFKIWIIIELPHSSDLNQVFDQDPAKASKQAARDILPEVREKLGLVINNKLDQWGLLKIVACCASAIQPRHWVNGFKRCNLHPKFTRSLQVWLSEITEHLDASSRMKTHSVQRKALSDLDYVRKKAPLFYVKLEDTEKARLLQLLREEGFRWDSDKALENLYAEFPAIKQRGRGLYELFTFVCALNIQKELGRVEDDAVMPDLSPNAPKEDLAEENKKEAAKDDIFIHYPSFLPLGEKHYSNYRRFVHANRFCRRQGVTLDDLTTDVFFHGPDGEQKRIHEVI
jgi:hypothetical protein